MPGLARAVASSPLARAAAFPLRLRTVLHHIRGVVRTAVVWLVRSREHTNFTYDLTPLNREHLAWWVATVTGADIVTVRGYFHEVESDADLVEHIRATTRRSPRRGLADREVRLHKRIGWYALVRALHPDHVVETGTDKGLGSVVLASALLRNGHGRLTTLDVNPESGYLITGRYAAVVDRKIGDSLAGLRELQVPVDMFLHDSLHTREHEAAEFEAVSGRLAPDAFVLSDNAHVTDALPEWAERTGRRFFYFHERPDKHWYPGAGIGIAVPSAA